MDDHALKSIDLSRAGNADGIRTRSKITELLWYFTEMAVLYNPLVLSSRMRALALRMFGAQIGQGVVLRSRLRVKYPWKLAIGDHCWIGEDVWIHNQDEVRIGKHCVVSQGTFITTGSHDTRKTMGLVTRPVVLEDGAWVTSRCIVLMGVTVGHNSIITPGSVVHKTVPPMGVYGGNPLKFIQERSIDLENLDQQHHH